MTQSSRSVISFSLNAYLILTRFLQSSRDSLRSLQAPGGGHGGAHPGWTADENEALVEGVNEYGLDCWDVIKAEAGAKPRGAKRRTGNEIFVVVI